MAVGTQRTRAIEIMENVAATMKTVSSETLDPQIKETSEHAAATLDHALETLNQRQ